jgi:hypothetical protein
VDFRLLALIALPVDHRAPMEKHKMRGLIVLFLGAIFISKIATVAGPALACRCRGSDVIVPAGTA